MSAFSASVGRIVMPVSANRKRRPSRGISINTTWQMQRPVRKPPRRASTAFISAGVAIWPFIKAAARPAVTSATAAPAGSAVSMMRNPAQVDGQLGGQTARVGGGPGEEGFHPSAAPGRR